MMGRSGKRRDDWQILFSKDVTVVVRKIMGSAPVWDFRSW